MVTTTFLFWAIQRLHIIRSIVNVVDFFHPIILGQTNKLS
jgi:hypothetical protein